MNPTAEQLLEKHTWRAEHERHKLARPGHALWDDFLQEGLLVLASFGGKPEPEPAYLHRAMYYRMVDLIGPWRGVPQHAFQEVRTVRREAGNSSDPQDLERAMSRLGLPSCDRRRVRQALLRTWSVPLELVPLRELGAAEAPEVAEPGDALQLLEELPEKEREIIRLHVLEGLTLEQVGQRRGGVTKEAIRLVEKRGLERLRRKVCERRARERLAA